MAVLVEFEYEGRTYRVDSGAYKWDIYALNAQRQNVVLTTDLLTGDKLFLSWSDIAVLRLVTDE